MPLDTIRLDVTGLSCGGCAARAERALQQAPGVQSASVNFATATATVTGGDYAAARAALAEAGYPAAETRVTLSIEGMSCASCVGRVEAALEAVPGVIDAHVNLATERAEIRALSGSVSGERLAQVVTQAGYRAQVQGDSQADVAQRKAEEAGTLRRDLTIAAILTLPVFVMEMGGHLWPPLHHWIAGNIGMQTAWAIQFVLVTLIMVWPGRRFYKVGLPLLAKATPDMNSLVALGTLAAWAYSSVALFAPGLLPQSAQNVYFESAAVIVTLILLGRLLEARAKGRTGAAIKRLIGLRPETARVERGGTIEDVAIAEVAVGDHLHLRPGERIAVDGMVLDGRSFVDEAMITGEPVPVEKTAGALVTGGTINGQGALRYEATAVGADTMLARIIALVEEAQGAKLPIQALADKVVLWFVPVVIAIALATMVIWLFLGPNISFALVAAVSVLIIACPCAMGLATPTSIMVGTGRAAEMGVLFRKGDALQGLESARVIAFDKTGTLTQGRPDLVQQVAAPGFDVAEVLRLAASAEQGSEHPIARALERAATGVVRPEDTEAVPGYGLRATVEGRAVLVGAPRLMAREGIATTPLDTALERFAANGQTPVLVALDGQIAGAFAVADPVKPGAANAIAALQARGLTVAMITGDTAATAHAIAEELRIDHVEAEVLPDGKRDAVERLRARFGPVAFCGDGINDAPALAAADVGLAIGTGTDVAIESADVILSSGDVAGAVNAHHVSHRVMRNIRQNLFWAFGYNVALIPVAAGVFYPVFGVMLSPMLAAGAMALSSVFVLSNALRLRGMRPALSETPPVRTPVLQEARA